MKVLVKKLGWYNNRLAKPGETLLLKDKTEFSGLWMKEIKEEPKEENKEEPKEEIKEVKPKKNKKD